MDLKATANTMTFKPTAFKPTVPPLRVGIDVGSTTVKFVALDENDNVCYSEYKRHLADIRGTIMDVVKRTAGERRKLSCHTV